MRRQRAEFGAKKQIRRGVWRLRWWGDAHDGRGYRRLSETFHGTAKEASARMALHQIETEGQGPVPTVGQVWHAHVLPRLRRGVDEGTRSQSTLDNYLSKWKNHVAPAWEGVPVTDVRPIGIQEWLLTKTKSTGHLSKAVLVSILDRAVMLDLVEYNVARRDYEYGEDVTMSRGIYSEGELDDIWKSVVWGTPAEMPFLLCAHEGLRVGEACGMCIDHISFEEWEHDDGRRELIAVMDASQQLRQKGGMTGRMKTKGSARFVAMGEPWSLRVREHMRELPEDAVYLNDRGCGEPYHRQAVRDAWEGAVKASGHAYLPMRSLRAAFETHRHWDDGMPLEQVSRFLGHSRLSTTLAHYDRPSQEHLKAQARSFVTGAPRTVRDD